MFHKLKDVIKVILLKGIIKSSSWGFGVALVTPGRTVRVTYNVTVVFRKLKRKG